MKNVVVIGAGAAGVIAAYYAAINGSKVKLIDKNEKIGKKLFITGKGRCNLTNDCEQNDFFNNVVTNSKFLYSAYYSYDQSMIMDLIQGAGCELKVERGNRVFPVSDHSSDIIKALNKLLKDASVEIILNTIVTSVDNNKVYTNKGVYEADSVIIATGGVSYPTTGSTGDGYKFAKNIGHNIKTPRGALVPLETVEDDAFLMQGLSLKNVEVTVVSNDKKIYTGFGEMLFTHFGVSGPLILSASSYYQKAGGNNGKIFIDLKPALSYKELDDRVLRDFGEAKNKILANALDKLLPQKMIPVVIKRSGINPEKRINEITKSERESLVNVIKKLEYTIKGTRPVSEAIITQGGIDVKEINPSTMESKIAPSVYFAGEVLDVDALTGGFNLQIAWSTGYLAGINAAIE